jgi:hypothetical protein
MSITGLECHPDVNAGDFVLQEAAVGGKPCWGNGALFLYSINQPHDGYAIGPNGPGLPEGMVRAHAALLETYEQDPPFGRHAWGEVCDASGNVEERFIVLTPDFTDNDCREALQLLTPELTEVGADAFLPEMPQLP